jgi:hypothetical protein
MTTKSSTEKYLDATNNRDAILVKLIIEADNLEVPASTKELLMDYLHAHIVANHVAKDNQITIIASNKRLTIRIDELEDRIGELEEKFADTATIET